MGKVNMSTSSISQIQEAIAKAYGDLSEPDFSFVQRTYEKRPYGDLLVALQADVAVEENTDLNDDVCVSLLLSGSGRRWSLFLSLIGRYAAFMRVDSRGVCDLLAQGVSDLSKIEEKILEKLAMCSVEPLGADMLNTPIQLRLQNADAQDVCLFQALFTDCEVLPWEASVK